MSLYRIITFDGGGVRGVFSAVLLKRLLAAHPHLLSSTALLAGTSTGGIIALALAAGFMPDEIISFYQQKAGIIFNMPVFDKIRSVNGWLGAEYSSKTLKTVLTDLFHQKPARTLDDLAHKVLIPSFNLDDETQKPPIWKPKFFHNYPGPDSDGVELIVDVAMRTSAAPTYFASYQGYIDGGAVANNPAMSALAQALNPGTGGQPLSAIRLLSIGTGINPRVIQGQTINWGKAQWARPITDLLIDGVMLVSTYECQQVLGDKQFFRLDDDLPKQVNMDDSGSIDALIGYADRFDLTAALAWLRANF